MPFDIGPETLANDEVDISEDDNGDLELVHVPSGRTFTLDETTSLSDLAASVDVENLEDKTSSLSSDGTEADLQALHADRQYTRSRTAATVHSDGTTYWADGPDGPIDDAEGDAAPVIQSALVNSGGGVMVYPGVYEINSEQGPDGTAALEIQQGQMLSSIGPRQVEGDKGTELRLTTDLSTDMDAMIKTRVSGGRGGGSDSPGLRGLFINGNDYGRTAVELTDRTAWLLDCVIWGGNDTNTGNTDNGVNLRGTQQRVIGCDISHFSNYGLVMYSGRGHIVTNSTIIDSFGAVRYRGARGSQLKNNRISSGSSGGETIEIVSHVMDDGDAGESTHQIHGNTIRTAADGAPTINVTGSSTVAHRISIKDNHLDGYDRLGETAVASNALAWEDTANMDWLELSGNNFNSYTADVIGGDLNDLVTDTLRVDGNRGQWESEDSGSVQASDGSTIAHGLGMAPSIPASRVETESSNRAYITGVDATNITIALEDPSGAAVTTDETVHFHARITA